MSKTLESLINEAEEKRSLWAEIAEDEQALKDRNKTKEEAIRLIEFFEGRLDGLLEARDVVNT